MDAWHLVVLDSTNKPLNGKEWTRAAILEESLSMTVNLRGGICLLANLLQDSPRCKLELKTMSRERSDLSWK